MRPYINKRLTSFRTSSGSDYPRNDWQNARYGFDRWTNQNAQNSWGHRHIARYSVFSAFPSQSWRVSVSIHNCRRNMDTPLLSGEKRTVKTVDFWSRAGSEKSEDDEIGWPRFFGCTRNHLHRLLGKKTNDNWSVLCVVIAPVERRNKKEILLFERLKRPWTAG